MEECIQRALDCYRVCLESAQHSLQKSGSYVDAVNILYNCSELCNTTATFLITKSNQHVNVCKLCAEICRNCAELCLEYKDDTLMLFCVDTCEKCAESCEAMSNI